MRARVEVGAGGAGVAVGRVGAGVRVAPAQALSVGRGGEGDENELGKGHFIDGQLDQSAAQRFLNFPR